MTQHVLVYVPALTDQKVEHTGFTVFKKLKRVSCVRLASFQNRKQIREDLWITSCGHKQMEWSSAPNVSLNVSTNLQSFSGPHQPGRSTNHKRQSQPTTVPLRTMPTRTINQPQTSVSTNHSPSQDHTVVGNPDDQPTTNVSLNQPQSLSGLCQPGRSTNHKRQSQPTTVPLRTTPTRTINQPQTSVSTNHSPSQDYANLDDQPTTNVSLNQPQSLSGLCQPGRSTNHKPQS